jgi:hypothetical protein
MDSTDYIILYAPAGETGETAFSFTTVPDVDLSNAPGVAWSFSDAMLTLNYPLNGLGVVKIKSGLKQTTVVLMDKATAFTWSAPVLVGTGQFGNYYGVGTNSSYVVVLALTYRLLTMSISRMLVKRLRRWPLSRPYSRSVRRYSTPDRRQQRN